MTTPAQRISPCPQPFSDHVVDTIEGVDVTLRVFPGKFIEGGGKTPWLFWIHGGGWVGGKHYIPNVWVHPAFHPLGIHIISVSYRFMPQATLDDIYSDLSKSFQWCLDNLSSVLGEDKVDVQRYIIGGDSAGGQLSAHCASHFQPKPLVELNIFGAVDLTDPHFSKGMDRPIPYGTSSEELERLVRDFNPANAVIASPWYWELEPDMSQETLRSFWGTDYRPGEGDKKRMDLNAYTSKNGSRIKAMFHLLDSQGPEAEEEFKRLTKEWSPTYHLTKDYPPTVVMHGEKDQTVLIKQSKDFADKLEKLGVEVKRIWSKDGGHSFEQSMGGPEDEGWEEFIVPCIEFVRKHTGV
ncbi:hypothetical protein L486_05038 [Kwoniella mangroviensis CBS 10435]|uniref:Uncharacterized protein n=1 Tax=Kwoniella mangroviensis CBS 10435 TaxID=1331196 RepID=A0A1B9IPU5_9TREE|nr:hypothetical protein L486_05038 [Kwoniella mangroviensis CBS 10435]